MHEKSTYLDLCLSLYLLASSSFLRALVSAVAILNSKSAPDQNTAEKNITKKLYKDLEKEKKISVEMLIFSSFFNCLFLS